jgi:hypothetical protein
VVSSISNSEANGWRFLIALKRRTAFIFVSSKHAFHKTRIQGHKKTRLLLSSTEKRHVAGEEKAKAK